jgi:hypothetical protein
MEKRESDQARRVFVGALSLFIVYQGWGAFRREDPAFGTLCLVFGIAGVVIVTFWNGIQRRLQRANNSARAQRPWETMTPEERRSRFYRAFLPTLPIDLMLVAFFAWMGMSWTLVIVIFLGSLAVIGYISWQRIVHNRPPNVWTVVTIVLGVVGVEAILIVGTNATVT